MVAAVMLVLGILALSPAIYVAWEASQLSGFEAENILFVILGTTPALGGALVVGAAWVFQSTKGLRA